MGVTPLSRVLMVSLSHWVMMAMRDPMKRTTPRMVTTVESAATKMPLSSPRYPGSVIRKKAHQIPTLVEAMSLLAAAASIPATADTSPMTAAMTSRR